MSNEHGIIYLEKVNIQFWGYNISLRTLELLFN